MRRVPTLLLLAILALFAAGLWHTFKLRFESGDVYPAYSSLRADPLGTMAFYEALASTPGLSARRDFDSQGRLPSGLNTTYLHLAADPREWDRLPESVYKEMEAFVVGGGRLVIAFHPEGGKLPKRWLDPEASAAPGPEDRKKGKRSVIPREDEGDYERRIGLREKWGVAIGALPLQMGEDETYEAATVRLKAEAPLPQTLPWHSSLILTNAGPAWEIIYARGRHPVIAERKFGKGAVVLATDSYFVSNQALRSERQTQLLTWVVGDSTRVYFDEAHLGIAEAPGIGKMIRAYQLHWLGLGLLALAGLFLWKNASSLAFPVEVEAGPDQVAGREAASGFINLLRRNLPVRDLLATCFSEWERSVSKNNPLAAARVERARERLRRESARSTDPVQAYREISTLLHPPRKTE